MYKFSPEEHKERDLVRMGSGNKADLERQRKEQVKLKLMELETTSLLSNIILEILQVKPAKM